MTDSWLKCRDCGKGIYRPPSVVEAGYNPRLCGKCSKRKRDDQKLGYTVGIGFVH